MLSVFDKNKVTKVLYHGKCPDGFGSAFCVWYYYKKNFSLERANQIEFVPCIHSGTELDSDFIEKLSGEYIVMCDFSYKYDQLKRIIDVAENFMILDHHETAQEGLEKISDNMKIFDMKRSGAGITWNYFFPDEPLPRFLELIQDYDLWTKKYSETDGFIIYVWEKGFTFDQFETYLPNDKFESIILTTVSKWAEYKRILVRNIAKNATEIIQLINNKLMIVVYHSSPPELVSYVGNKVFKYYPMGDFSAGYTFDLEKSETRFSLRSTDDRYSARAICEMHGGGGHRNASGMKLNSITPFLPHEKYDSSILKVLRDRKTGPIIYNTCKIPTEEIADVIKKDFYEKKLDNRIKIEYDYSILEADILNKDWFSEHYLGLIKRKLNDSRYFVFKTKSEKVNFDPGTNIVTHLTDYYIIFNNENINNIENKLAHSALVTETPIIELSTEKSFEDIFELFIKKNNSTIADPISDEDDSYDDDNSDDEQ